LYMLILWCPSRAIMFESGSVDGLLVEIMARDGISQIFPSKFQPVLHYIYIYIYIIKKSI
jgi:hypothetical protein